MGFILGYVVQSRIPAAIRYGGRWVWAAPTLLLTFAGIDDFVQFSWKEAVLLFLPGAEGEAAWSLIVVTLPTLACCFYSLGMVAANHSQHRRGTFLPESKAVP